MKVSPAAMIIVGDDALGVPLGGARLELSQTMPVYKDGRTFCPPVLLCQPKDTSDRIF